MVEISSTEEFGFWDKIKYLFSDFNLFFEKIRLEHGIKNSILMYTTVKLFFTIIGIIFTMICFFLPSSKTPELRSFIDFLYYYIGIDASFILTLLIIFSIIGLVMTFLYSGLIHVIMIAFKGEGTYWNVK